MDWKRLLAYITGSVDQELLLRNEYLAAENHILRNQIRGRLRLTDGERRTLAQSEWVTDVMFKDSNALAEIYPSLSLHAITKFSSPDVMRFLGRKAHHAFKGEIVSDFKNRPEGIRVKHRVKGNSIKMYDKAGCVLRVETTLNQPKDLKVFRPKQGDPEDKLAWLPLRKGVADIYRRAKLSEDSNMRYLDTLGTIEIRTPVGQIVKDICRPTSLKGKRVRALRPWSDVDSTLLRTVIRGEFAVTGFRNRDIRRLLYPVSDSSPIEGRRRSSSTTRLLRILRAHGVIKKIPKTHRYQVAKQGRLIITAVLAASRVPSFARRLRPSLPRLDSVVCGTWAIGRRGTGPLGIRVRGRRVCDERQLVHPRGDN